jgi:nucleotide-binding universal stress UspA family protein
MGENILVPLDGSKVAEAALPYAQELAVKLGAGITLVRVKEIDAPGQPIPELYLKAKAETLKGRVNSVEMEGDPAEKIAEYADQEGGLIVMTHHGQSGSRLKGLGSVADRVVRTTKCPVAVIKPVTRPAAASNALLNRVVLALDGTVEDQINIPPFEDFAARVRPEVVLFQVLGTGYDTPCT